MSVEGRYFNRNFAGQLMTRALPNPPSIMSIARSPEATLRNVVTDLILSRWNSGQNRHPSAAHLDVIGAGELALVATGDYQADDSDRIYPNDDPAVMSRMGERSKRFNRALNSKDFVSALNDAASIFVTNPAGYDLSHRKWCAQTQLVDFRPAATFQVLPLELKKLPNDPFEANRLDRKIVTVEGNDLEVQTVGGFVTFSRQLLKNNRFDLLAETIKSLIAACYRAERTAVLKVLLDDDSIEAPEKRLFNSENDAPNSIESGSSFAEFQDAVSAKIASAANRFGVVGLSGTPGSSPTFGAKPARALLPTAAHFAAAAGNFSLKIATTPELGGRNLGFLLPDPALNPVILLGHLSSTASPMVQIFTESDAIHIKAVFDFATTFVSRSAVRFALPTMPSAW
ncbi:hypothetical protein [Chromatium okenii]|jgi:hypothetical protein|uniref:phage major capsid protein n=1 Tax=Chromatium okenii TaxID=61644 RepID=UPI0026EDEC5C|nr:hypothetical protein [Chromatium okenii]MBV5311144.1 hypothetical protein [Chromatium okenii]